MLQIYIGLHKKNTHYSCQILMELAFSQHFFENSSNIKFHENPLGSEFYFTRKNGRADMMKLIVAFLSFNNVP
jgi:hypothetical protein